MADNDGSDNLSKVLLDRLNAFLLSSSFLVAAFVALITVTSQVSSEKIQWLILSVSILGCIIGVAYFSMNLYDSLKKEGYHVHTWVMPLIFVIFWVVSWSIFAYEGTFVPTILFIIGVFVDFGVITAFIKLREWYTKRKKAS